MRLTWRRSVCRAQPKLFIHLRFLRGLFWRGQEMRTLAQTRCSDSNRSHVGCVEEKLSCFESTPKIFRRRCWIRCCSRLRGSCRFCYAARKRKIFRARNRRRRSQNKFPHAHSPTGTAARVDGRKRLFGQTSFSELFHLPCDDQAQSRIARRR